MFDLKIDSALFLLKSQKWNIVLWAEQVFYVSTICLGTMTWGGRGRWEAIGRVGQDEAVTIN